MTNYQLAFAITLYIDHHLTYNTRHFYSRFSDELLTDLYSVVMALMEGDLR